MKTVLLTMVLLVVLCPAAMPQGHSLPFAISVDSSAAGWPQAAYSPSMSIYLVVWEDYRNGRSDIYGQFVYPDGTLRGENLPICTAPGDQFWPRLDYDPVYGRFLIVFEDWRDGNNGDIRGVFIGDDAVLHMPPGGEADYTFPISSHAANIYTCSVAYNPREKCYLVVWGDFRNDPGGASFTGADVFGQLISHEGILLPPPEPAAAAGNFAIAANPDYFESVADVTYNQQTREFFVVYGTSKGLVLGQRVDHQGRLIAADGLPAPAGSPGVPVQISESFDNSPDAFQARVQSNATPLGGERSWSECEVIWKGKQIPDRTDNDIWGQRVLFVKDNDLYKVRFADLNGAVTSTIQNHSISYQTDHIGVAEIAYNSTDNEYLVAWGDPRTGGFRYQDLYAQRLWVDESRQVMLLISDDRNGTVGHDENIPLVISKEAYEGSLTGVAYGHSFNNYLVVYTFEDALTGRESDIMGLLVYGNRNSRVESTPPAVKGWKLQGNYPNPFNQETRIEFTLDEMAQVNLSVFDLSGKRVRTLFDGVKLPGDHTLSWSGSDEQNQPAATGIYYLVLRKGREVEVQKMTLLR